MDAGACSPVACGTGVDAFYPKGDVAVVVLGGTVSGPSAILASPCMHAMHDESIYDGDTESERARAGEREVDRI
jgi:hypothetical protein